MKIHIKSIADKRIYEKERLVLRVLSDCDIGDYLVIQAGFINGEITIDTYYTYWFPYKDVSRGDLIVLYTKSGKENEKVMKNGKKAHFFYWGLRKSIWSSKDRAPVLLYAPEWESKNPDEL